MARRKRSFSTFNLSFLDIMSCGFGAVVLFFMIINHATKDHSDQVNRDLISETNLLEKRVELGDGTSLDYDYLVIATGPKLAFD